MRFHSHALFDYERNRTSIDNSLFANQLSNSTATLVADIGVNDCKRSHQLTNCATK